MDTHGAFEAFIKKELKKSLFQISDIKMRLRLYRDVHFNITMFNFYSC